MFFKTALFRFSSNEPSPLIIDCGANVGVSVAWWKAQYPNSRVVAFEADPNIYQVLQRNCGHLPNVTLVNAALWNCDGEVSFAAKGGEGGHLALFSDQSGSGAVRNVPSVRLSSYLLEKCAFLKMDIEGAETEVIRECADKFDKVSRMFVEYHSFVNRPQLLGEMLNLVEAAGFRVHVHVELPSPAPFQELLEYNQKDLRLDLFCFKKDAVPSRKILN